jgi:hypothetical protein
LQLVAGDAGVGSATNANGGSVYIDSGARQGAGTSTTLVGTTNATAINIGSAATNVKVIGLFGCNNATPQAAAVAGAALAAYATGAFGLNSDVNMTALYNLVVAMRAALVANGIMKVA